MTPQREATPRSAHPRRRRRLQCPLLRQRLQCPRLRPRLQQRCRVIRLRRSDAQSVYVGVEKPRTMLLHLNAKSLPGVLTLRGPRAAMALVEAGGLRTLLQNAEPLKDDVHPANNFLLNVTGCLG